MTMYYHDAMSLALNCSAAPLQSYYGSKHVHDMSVLRGWPAVCFMLMPSGCVGCVCIVPVCLLAKAVKQKTLFAPSNGSSLGITVAVVRWAFGCTLDVVSTMIFAGSLVGFRVLFMPALGRFIQPFDVAGDFAKCF